MKNKSWNLKTFDAITKIIKSFSITEKITFYIFAFFFIASTLFILNLINREISDEIPAHGGEITEGLIGVPRFINPILAFSDTDKDLSAIIYSGLMKKDSEGKLEKDLAESYEISEDQLTYTFTIRDNATFHDGSKISTDDIIFTIEKAKTPEIKSPKRINWEGVEIERLSDKKLSFKLKKVYTPFIWQTTIGILPKHLWKDVALESFSFDKLNTEPVGSGPYKLKSIKKDENGSPQSYALSAFREYIEGEPYLTEINFIFYGNKENLLAGYKAEEIESIGAIDPKDVSQIDDSSSNINKIKLLRVFAIFLNQNQNAIFSLPEIREALKLSIDKDKIIKDVFLNFGTKIDSPIPSYALKENKTINTPYSIENAKNILTDASWKVSTTTGILEKSFTKKNSKEKEIKSLDFSLATVNTPELIDSAEIIKSNWENLGAKISLKIFEPSELNQNIIRPRKFDALLFGEVLGDELDLFAFWHSSQRNDPGLNIALYTNATVDKILENLVSESKDDARKELYSKLESEINKDVGAIFLYSPQLIYVTPKTLKNINLKEINSSSDRFANINEWYTETEMIWKFLR